MAHHHCGWLPYSQEVKVVEHVWSFLCQGKWRGQVVAHFLAGYIRMASMESLSQAYWRLTGGANVKIGKIHPSSYGNDGPQKCGESVIQWECDICSKVKTKAVVRGNTMYVKVQTTYDQTSHHRCGALGGDSFTTQKYSTSAMW